MRVRLLSTIVVTLILLGVTPTMQAQRTGPVPQSPTRQMQQLLPKIEKKIENLNAEIDRVADRGTVSSDTTERLSEYLAKLDEDIAGLSGSLDTGDPVNAEVRAALVSGTRVDQFMTKNRVSTAASTQWRALKRDLISLATYNRISWNWRQSVPALSATTSTAVVPTPVPSPTPYATPYPTPYQTPYPSGQLYTATESQMSTLLSRIDLKTGIFRSQLQTALNAGGGGRDDSVLAYLSKFENSASRLRQQFGRRDATLLDVTDVLTSATYVDQYMSRNQTTTEAQAQWRDLRNELNTLAGYYRQSWNWNQDLPTGPYAGGTDLRGFSSRITGTYRLNNSLSEDPTNAIDRALGSVNSINRDNYRISLERRLRAPDMLAIEMQGRNVTMASSNQAKVSFQADGTARSETNDLGRTVTTTATVDEDGLMVTYLGQRSNDFYLTIVPATGGRLRVTRRVFLDESNEGISVTSVYDKIDNLARWTGLGQPNMGDTTAIPGGGSIIVPVGTRLTAELRTPLTSSSATDRVSLDVTSFGQFRRATINGRVLFEDPRSRVAGRARALIAFDTITLANGNTYAFSGDVISVTTPDGQMVDVTNQAATSATTTQPQRGVGGILGALIGAISGVPVGQGTVATQAGAILSQRGDVLTLDVGTQFVITATAPRR